MTEIQKFINDGINNYIDLWSYGQDEVTLDKLAESISKAYDFNHARQICDPDSNFHYGRLCGFCECLQMIIEYNRNVSRIKETMETETLLVLTKLLTEQTSVLHSDLRRMLNMTDERLHASLKPAINCKMVDCIPNGDEGRYLLTITGRRYLQGVFGFMVKGDKKDEELPST